jgi:hypothetical protein
MVVRSQSEIDEIPQKHDLVALREMLKNEFPSAVARVMTAPATQYQSHQGDHPPISPSFLHDHHRSPCVSRLEPALQL